MLAHKGEALGVVYHANCLSFDFVVTSGVG